MTAFLRDRHDFRAFARPAVAFPGVSPTPVILSGPTATSITQDTVEITWTVDRPVTGQTHYGLTDAYGQTSTKQFGFAYSTHIQTISGLTPGTTYHVKVMGEDEADEVYDSSLQVGDYTFQTLGGEEPPPEILYPTIVNPLAFQSLVTAAEPSYLGVHNCSHQSGTTQVIRVTNTAGQRCRYASLGAWNADMTKLAMGRGAQNQKAILNGETFAVLQSGSAAEYSWSLYWSMVDPARGWSYGNNTSQALQRRVINSNGTSSVQATVSAANLGHAEASFGGGQGQQDRFDKFIAYSWRNSDGAYGIGMFDLQAWTAGSSPASSIHAERQMGTGASSLSSVIDHVGTSLSGQWMHVTFLADGSGVTQGMWCYEANLNTTTRRQASQNEQHWDWGATEAYADRFVFWSGSGIRSFNPVTGAQVNMGPPTTAGSTHISCRNWAAPGWALVSRTNVGGSAAGYGQLFAVKIDDPNPADVRVYAFLHRTQAPGYDHDPHAVISPDGRFVTWGGKWEGNANTYGFVAAVDLGL